MDEKEVVRVFTKSVLAYWANIDYAQFCELIGEPRPGEGFPANQGTLKARAAWSALTNLVDGLSGLGYDVLVEIVQEGNARKENTGG